MNILSLFDGYSGGRHALEQVNAPITNYFASDINKHATAVTRYHYPGTRFLGDVKSIQPQELPEIDGLMAGFPCTSLSLAGKQRGLEALSLADYLLAKPICSFKGQSYLFWETVRLIRTTRPTWFLLENVRMKRQTQDKISQTLGVEPIVINSNLVSAQNRHRLYWVGVRRSSGSYEQVPIAQPLNRHITLKSIVEAQGDSQALSSADARLILEREVGRKKITRVGDDYIVHGQRVSLQRAADYCYGCLTPSRLHARQNGQRFNKGKKFYTLTKQDRHGLLLNGCIRKITPTEAERLQTLPDDYTRHGITSSGELVEITAPQRMAMLGDGWTSEVIQHTLKHLLEISLT